MMRAITMNAYGKNDVLTLAEVAKPAVGPDDVLIQVEAASLNPIDFKFRDGGLRLIRNVPLPIVVGNDVAGRVVEIGINVKGFTKGDAVFARVDKYKLGAFAEFVAIDQHLVAKKPRSLDFEAAAGVPLVALTAWQALYEDLRLKSGQRIFIPAGAGGVGGMAIQLARLAGAYVITSASKAGMEVVRKYGPDKIIDYKVEDPADVVRDVDAVFDLLGGDALMKSFAMLKPGGRVCSIAGMPTKDTLKDLGAGGFKQFLFNVFSSKLRGAAKNHGVTYSYLFMRPDGGQLAEIAELIDAGKLTTVVDRVYPMSQFKEAFTYAESGRAKGKIILKIAGA